MTADELIRQALLKVEAVGYSDTVPTVMAADGLINLNNLISSWNAETLLIPSITKVTKTLTAGTASYTIGSGGDINTTRPISISRAFIRDTSNYDYDLDIRAMDEYASITAKTTQSQPRYLFYNPAYSLGKIYLYSTPDDSTDVLHLDLVVPLAEIATGGTTVDLPNEYKRALIYNLAFDLDPSFDSGSEMSIAAIAAQSKAVLKGLNANVVPLARFDSMLNGGGSGRNIYTDGE